MSFFSLRSLLQLLYHPYSIQISLYFSIIIDKGKLNYHFKYCLLQITKLFLISYLVTIFLRLGTAVGCLPGFFVFHICLSLILPFWFHHFTVLSTHKIFRPPSLCVSNLLVFCFFSLSSFRCR